MGATSDGGNFRCFFPSHVEYVLTDFGMAATASQAAAKLGISAKLVPVQALAADPLRRNQHHVRRYAVASQHARSGAPGTPSPHSAHRTPILGGALTNRRSSWHPSGLGHPALKAFGAYVGIFHFLCAAFSSGLPLLPEKTAHQKETNPAAELVNSPIFLFTR